MKTGPLLAVLLTAGLVACQAGTGAGVDGTLGPGGQPGKGTSPVAIASRLPNTATVLAGRWVFGDKNEPPPGPVVTCAPNQVLEIVQEGPALGAGVTVCPGLCRQVEKLTGEVKEGHVTLSGTYQGNLDLIPRNLAYDMNFNAQTEHLTGTREGTKFWAAPIAEPAAGCPVSPTPAPLL